MPTPWMGRVLPLVAELAGRFPRRTVFTRFIPPRRAEDMPGMWQRYYATPHVYIRGHGRSGRYHGSYSVQTLRRWADAIARYKSERRDVFVYFDNDQKAAAPKDAKRLIALLED